MPRTSGLLAATELEKHENARKAILEARKLLNGWRAAARMLSRNPNMDVKLTAGGTSCTDGKIIYIKVPYELAFMPEHERSQCGVREEHDLLVCPACDVLEDVNITVIHEVAHSVFETFDEMTEYERARIIEQAVKLHAEGKPPQSRIAQIEKRLKESDEKGIRDYLSLSQHISPFLPLIINACEDIRVNGRMQEERPGTRVMFNAQTAKVFRDGIKDYDGTSRKWSEMPPNAQAIIGLYCKAGGFDYEHALNPEIIERIDDPILNELCAKVAHTRSVQGIYRISLPLLERLRELGFCLDPDDPQDEPEEEPDQSEDNSEQSEEQDDNDEASDSGSGQDDASGDSNDSGSLDREEERDSSSSSEDQDSDSESDADEVSGTDASPDGDHADDDSEESEDLDDSDNQAEEAGSSDSSDSEGNGESSGDEDDDNESEASEGSEDSDTDSEGGSDGSDSRDESSTDGTSDTGDQSETSDDDSGESSDEESGSSDATSSDGSGEDSEGDEQSENDSDNPESGDDTVSSEVGEGDSSSSEVDESSDVDGQSDEAGPEEQPDPLDQSEDNASDGPDGPPSGDDSSSPASDPETMGQPTPDPSNGPETPGKDSQEAYTQADQERDGTPEDVEHIFTVFGRHEEQSASPSEAQEEQELEKAIELSLEQMDFFDSPSLNIGGVKVYQYGDREAAWRENSRYVETEPIPVPESVLTQSLMKMRLVFTDNARGRVERNRKVGKVDARVLGKRVSTGDERIFKKKVQPGKKDYFVLIGIDCSGSTSAAIGYRQERLDLIKAAAGAKAEMLSRLGIDFAMYAHSGDFNALAIFEIKGPKDRWGKTHREALQKLRPYSANLDGHSLEYYRKVVERRGETDRLILYYTDGAMPAANYHEELEILQREIKMCQTLDIHLVGVGVNTDSPTEHGLDTIRLDEVSDIPTVVTELRKRLEA